MNNTARFLSIAAVAAFASFGAQADEADASQFATKFETNRTRAEVQADLNLWNRAGLGQANAGDRTPDADPAYEARVAEYRRLRSGPEFVAEVRRLGGDVSRIAGQAAASTAH